MNRGKESHVAVSAYPLISCDDLLKYFCHPALEEFLKAGQLKEADQETAGLMLKVANREKEKWLDNNDIKNFPCEVLSKIDRLWLDNSQGRFGLSVQAWIYVSDCNGRFDEWGDEKTWQCFADKVGWYVNNRWLAYSELTFSSSARKGHLPSLYINQWRWVFPIDGDPFLPLCKTNLSKKDWNTCELGRELFRIRFIYLATNYFSRAVALACKL